MTVRVFEVAREKVHDLEPLLKIFGSSSFLSRTPGSDKVSLVKRGRVRKIGDGRGDLVGGVGGSATTATTAQGRAA